MAVLTWIRTHGNRVSLGILAAVVATAPASARDASPQASDAPLVTAMRGDDVVRGCDCVVSAMWINESYPRVVVDERRWRKLPAASRARFADRALKVAERVYLAEFAAVDQYQRVFVVDRHGKTLLAFGSG